MARFFIIIHWWWSVFQNIEEIKVQLFIGSAWMFCAYPEKMAILKWFAGSDPEKHAQIKNFAGLIFPQFSKTCTVQSIWNEKRRFYRVYYPVNLTKSQEFSGSYPGEYHKKCNSSGFHYDTYGENPVLILRKN